MAEARIRRVDDEYGSPEERRAAFARRRTEALDYIQSMLGQLRTMAQGERYDMLGYLIEMAYIEASDIIRGQRPSNLGDRHRDRSA